MTEAVQSHIRQGVSHLFGHSYRPLVGYVIALPPGCVLHFLNVQTAILAGMGGRRASSKEVSAAGTGGVGRVHCVLFIFCAKVN